MEPTKTKPFTLIVLAAFGMLALVGLFLFAHFKGFNSGTQIGSVTIWGTLPQQAVANEISALQTAHREYSGITYVQVPPDSFESDLAEALAVGNGPDLILISQEDLLAEQNKLAVIPYKNISQRTFIDTFVPITELYLTDQGTYGIPFAVDPLVMYYNRTLLESAGIAQPPTTWEAVGGMAERLTSRSGGQLTKSLIAFGEYQNVPNARGIISLLLLQAGSKISQATTLGMQSSMLQSSAGVTYGSSPSESAINFYTQFADPAKTVYSWNGSMLDARQAFQSGDLALYFGYASELPYIRAANPNLDFDMASVPQPATSAHRITYAKAYAFAIPKRSNNPNGALSVAFALANTDIAPSTAAALSMVPAARAALTPSPQDRFQPVYFPEALVAEGWLSPSPATTDRIFAAMIGSITSGRADLSQALATADQALDAALKP